MRVEIEPEDVLLLEEAEGGSRVERRGDGGAVSDPPARGDAVRSVCGWCGGPVGASGECERACDACDRRERRG